MVLECPSVHTDVQRFLAQCNLVTQGFQCFFLKLLLLFDFKTTYKVLNSDCFTIYSMQMFKMKLQEPGLLHFWPIRIRYKISVIIPPVCSNMYKGVVQIVFPWQPDQQCCHQRGTCWMLHMYASFFFKEKKILHRGTKWKTEKLMSIQPFVS